MNEYKRRKAILFITSILKVKISSQKIYNFKPLMKVILTKQSIITTYRQAYTKTAL